ncbi:MAG: hypothetical protein QF464_18755, partial [Myxococcota bacterium]|nr:hypothetical protein [Myxococcota bacterium]
MIHQARGRETQSARERAPEERRAWEGHSKDGYDPPCPQPQAEGTSHGGDPRRAGQQRLPGGG